MVNAIYTGSLHHQRLTPKVHRFSYPVAFFYLDLDRIAETFKVPLFFSDKFPRILGFNRKDYLKGKSSLKETVCDLVEKKTGKRPNGPIRILTQIRYFGFCFNPVSFYYCFDESDTRLEFIASEITNTPWNERMPYAFEFEGKDFEFRKDFHVSPFFTMNYHYVWSFNAPTPATSDSKLRVLMKNFEFTADGKKGDLAFRAILEMKPMPLTAWNLTKTVLTHPLLTFRSFLAIYLQAFLIFCKGVPFVPHPDSEKS
ncbi:MAG: DUF1365 family protein [Bdellovibrionales bacterium]|nr:DUF1365 family protein [Bdellovibrionales bacterium]